MCTVCIWGCEHTRFCMEVFTHPVYIFIHLLIKTNILGGWLLGWVLGVCVCGGGGGRCWWGQRKVMAVMWQYKKDSSENVISSRGTLVRICFRSPFTSKVVVCGCCLVTLSLTIMKTLKWLSSLPTLMQKSFWW